MRHQHGVLESAASSRRGDDPVMLRPSLPLGEGRTQCAGSACVTTTKRFRLLEKKPRTASAIFTMLLLWLLFLFREQVSLGADLPRRNARHNPRYETWDPNRYILGISWWQSWNCMHLACIVALEWFRVGSVLVHHSSRKGGVVRNYLPVP